MNGVECTQMRIPNCRRQRQDRLIDSDEHQPGQDRIGARPLRRRGASPSERAVHFNPSDG